LITFYAFSIAIYHQQLLRTQLMIGRFSTVVLLQASVQSSKFGRHLFGGEITM